MTADVRRIESKLRAIVHEADCGICAQRTGAVTGLWDDGHHRQAVDEASRAIELRLKAKLGTDLSGTPLIAEAFNPASPKEGQKRLRFVEFEEGTRAWTDAHQGAMNFGQGACSVSET